MDHNDPWAAYARAQRLADRYDVSNKSWAADEAAGEILERIARGEPISNAAEANLLVNRAAKYRRRCRLLLANLVDLQECPQDLMASIVARAELTRCAANCDEGSWKVLFAASIGESYETIAGRLGIPVSTAKTWVRRSRLKLAA